MKAFLLFSGSPPLVILTSHEGIEDPDLLERLAAKGIRKFVAFPVPIEAARSRYGVHFDIIRGDVHETDDLRVLDYDGHRAMEILPFSVLGDPIYHEGHGPEDTSVPRARAV